MLDTLKQIQREMEYSNLEMLEMAEYFDGLDDADFDNMDDAEYAEYMDYLDELEGAEKKHRIRRPTLHRRKHSTHRKPHGKHRGGQHKRRSGHTGVHKAAALAAIGGGGAFARKGMAKAGPTTFGSKAYINDLMTKSKGDLNITVTRETAAIAGVKLPYILFDLNGVTSNFISTLQAYMPAGITMTVSSDPATGDMLQTFTDGTNTDIVRISLTGSQISYTEFLQSMSSNYFKTRYIRQEYQNDSNLLLGVSQTINFGLLSALGAKGANNLLPRSRRLNDDYQTFIINLFLPEQKVTTDFSFVQKILAVAGYTIAWDVFMSDRTNLNNI